MGFGADSAEWYAGGILGSNTIWANEWQLTPEGSDAPGSVVVTHYMIHQRTGGTAICLVFYDLEAGPPVDGTATKNNDLASDCKFIVKIAAATDMFLAVPIPGHIFRNNLSVVASTSETTLTRASADTLFAVNYINTGNFAPGS